MAQGLGAFVQGLQGGIETRSKKEIASQYRRILSGEADVADREFADREALDLSQWKTEHGGTEGYVPSQAYQMKDPALLKFGKFLGGKIKGFFGGAGEEGGAMEGASFVSPEVQQPQPLPQAPSQYSGVPPQYKDGGVVRYADGGGVTDEDRERYAAMNEEARNAPTDGGGFGAYMGDVGRHAMGGIERGFQSTISEARDIYADQGVRREALTEEGISARERGGRTREYMGEALLGAPRMLSAATKDVLAPVMPLIEGAAGFIGMDGGGEPPAVAAEQGTTGDTAKDQAAAGIDDGVSDEEITERAMTAGEQQAVENFDYQLLADQGVDPEKLPSMNTTDWADHRSAVFQYELSRGASTKEAYEAMDTATVDVQMKGMMRELDKAFLYIEANQGQAAALALRQGFQYFPNGVDVKFGSTVDPKTGRPALMAIGYDEETGETTGAPMLITVDRLRNMRENMSDPSAFRTWTKDSHQLQLDIAKLGETEKHHTAMEDIYATNAATSAQRASSAAAGGGISAGEGRQRDVYYGDQIEKLYPDLMYDNPQDVTGLTSAMSKVERLMPNMRPAEVTDEVMRIYNDPNGGNAGVEALIKSLLERRNTGIPEG